MKIIMFYSALLISMFLSACSGTGPSQANADTVNTTAKLLASNIIIDNTNTSLNSNNLQSAVEELSPKIERVLVGTWSATNFPTGGAIQTAKVTFKSDGTFSLDSGSSYLFENDMAPLTGKWQNQKDVVIQTQFDGIKNPSDPMISGPYTIRYQRVVSVNSSKIILERFGNVTVLERMSP